MTLPSLTCFARVLQSAAKPERLILGLMSGTSVDGVDAALVRISGSARQTRLSVPAFVTVPFGDALRNRILALARGEGNAEEVSRVNFLLGSVFGDAVSDVLSRAGVSADQLDVIASHGQTISHTAPYATLQIGEPAVLAERFGVPVLSDFRTADIAAGGQGAPLTPYADWCLLTHSQKTRAVQNIGGISNVTYLPPDARAEDVRGFDTGPGNMLLDLAAQWATGNAERCDTDGRIAGEGRVDPALLAFALEHPFLLRTPPKSAGREEFGAAFFTRLLDWGRATTDPGTLLATLTAFTAESIADAYRRFLPRLPDEVIVGGGGARNPTLLRYLREAIAPAAILTHSDVGMNGDSKEAVAFALLANEMLQGVCSSLPRVTGARHAVLQGKWTLP